MQMHTLTYTHDNWNIFCGKSAALCTYLINTCIGAQRSAPQHKPKYNASTKPTTATRWWDTPCVCCGSVDNENAPRPVNLQPFKVVSVLVYRTRRLVDVYESNNSRLDFARTVIFLNCDSIWMLSSPKRPIYCPLIGSAFRWPGSIRTPKLIVILCIWYYQCDFLIVCALVQDACELRQVWPACVRVVIYVERYHMCGYGWRKSRTLLDKLFAAYRLEYSSCWWNSKDRFTGDKFVLQTLVSPSKTHFIALYPLCRHELDPLPIPLSTSSSSTTASLRFKSTCEIYVGQNCFA